MSDKNNVNAEQIRKYQHVLMLQTSASYKKYGAMFVIGYFWPSMMDTGAQFKLEEYDNYF